MVYNLPSHLFSSGWWQALCFMLQMAWCQQESRASDRETSLKFKVKSIILLMYLYFCPSCFRYPTWGAWIPFGVIFRIISGRPRIFHLLGLSPVMLCVISTYDWRWNFPGNWGCAGEFTCRGVWIQIGQSWYKDKVIFKERNDYYMNEVSASVNS